TGGAEPGARSGRGAQVPGLERRAGRGIAEHHPLHPFELEEEAGLVLHDGPVAVRKRAGGLELDVGHGRLRIAVGIDQHLDGEGGVPDPQALEVRTLGPERERGAVLASAFADGGAGGPAAPGVGAGLVITAQTPIPAPATATARTNRPTRS